MTSKNTGIVLGLFLTAGVALGCSSWIDPPRLQDRDAAAAPLPDAANRPVSFKMDIRPLMNRTNWDPNGHGCKACHYPEGSGDGGLAGFWGAKGTDSTNLDLSTLGAIRQGGYHTANDMIIPGDPANSAFVQKLRGSFYLGAKMPKDGPPFWSEAQIQLVERWIREGAVGADTE
jgi:hypothetical protein